jgi:hypoxanthine phosphoribosyltransferase
VKELIGLNSSLEGRDVVVIEDIIDSGFTMKSLLQKLEDMKVASVKVATMLFKPNAFKFDYKIDYIGMNIGNEFIVGYGLDYNQHGRNYGSIYKVID